MSATKSPHPLRWLVRASLALGILLLLVFVGSNLFLSSNPGKNFLKKNINRRTSGVSWQIAGATWSPWSGITVKEMTARLANKKKPNSTDTAATAATADRNQLPLLELKDIQIKPYWGQLLRGKKLFREVILNEPQINIPLEMLVVSEPAPRPPLPKATRPPIAKPKPQQPKPKPEPKLPKKQPATKPSGEAQKNPQPVAPQQKKPLPKNKAVPKNEPAPIDEKRFWVRLRNAKVRVYSKKLGKGIDIHAINADLPLGGPPTNGSLTWEKITLGKHLLSSKKSLPIEWKSPTWTLPNHDLQLTLPQLVDDTLPAVPLQMRIGGRFSPRRKSRDFRFQASLPPQPIPDYLLHRPSRLHLQAQSLAATFAGRGSLPNPKSWSFDSAIALNSVEAFSALRGQHFPFDTARAQLKLRNATLLAPSLSLRSERLSFLGNGQLHLGGQLLSVIRIVADQELSDRFTRVAIGSRISRGWTSQWLKPLQTPDRRYRDLHFEGLLPNAQVDTGRQGELISLPHLIDYLKDFTDQEVAEELPLTLTPSRNTP